MLQWWFRGLNMQFNDMLATMSKAEERLEKTDDLC
jgi:hypothetical protein